MPERNADEITVISALGEPTRRALYEHIVSVGGWVSRDDAADALDLERGTAAHHLDRLAEDGLLEVDFRRLSGRSGPGAGRPSKLYRRARREFDVALPPREYELAGQLLAEGADRARRDGVDITRALDDAARDAGRRLAQEASQRPRGKRSRADRQQMVLDALARHGYEPQVGDDDTVILRNCPFHQLAQTHRELICGMNHCLVSTAVEMIGGTGLSAALEPDADTCCVKLHPRDD